MEFAFQLPEPLAGGMETKDGQAKSPGICLRLFNFVTKRLTMRPILTSRTKDVTAGSQVTVAVDLVEGETMIPVEHQETWDGVDVVKVDVGLKNGVLKTARDQLDATKKQAAKKMVSIKDGNPAFRKVASMKEKAVSEEKRNAGSTVLRPSKPVLMVASNINEKSDAFIQTKKESLRKGV